MLLPQGPRTPVVVIGEALADVFDHTSVLGGAPFNVARTLAAFEVPTRFISRIGRDAIGREILAELQRFGLGAEDLQTDGLRPSGVVRVHESADGLQPHRFEIVPAQAYDYLDAQAALEALGDEDPPLVCFGTLAMRNPCSRAAIAAVTRRCAGMRLLDINLRDTAREAALAEQALHLACTLKLNDDELPQLLEWFVHPGQPPAPFGSPAQRDAIAALMSRFGLNGLLLTRGPHGSAWFGAQGEEPVTAPASSAEVVDTVGAGDAFTATFVLGHLAHWPMAQRLARGNQVAAAVCGLRGAVSPDPQFYRRWCARWAAEAPTLGVHE